MKTGVRIVYNKLLGGWFVVRGPHQTPISGRFATKEEAKASIDFFQKRPHLQPKVNK